MFESALNYILGPFLGINPALAIILISFILTLAVTIIYKYATNQSLMKVLKEDIKKFQNEMKQFKDDPKKAMDIQKQAMQVNMKYMLQTMKVTLITLIPFLLIFGWLSTNFSYYPIKSGEEFGVSAFFDKASGNITMINIPEGITLISEPEQQIGDNKASWKLKGNTGEHLLEFDYKSKTYKKELLITDKYGYKTPITTFNDGELKRIEFSNKKLTAINLFGWKIGWFGTYIIFSVVFSLALRKLFKVH